MPGKVMVSKDLKEVRIVNGAWSQTFPASSLKSQLALYEGLAAKPKGQSYQYAVDGLRRAADRIAKGLEN